MLQIVSDLRFCFTPLAYTRRADVLNRGFSGYNTRHALEMIPRVFRTIQQDEQDRVLFCTVFLGANDSALKGERQHVPIDEFEQNIEKIVKDIRYVLCCV